MTHSCLVLFCFVFLYIPLKGAAIYPPSGTNLTLLPDGLPKEIKWTYNGTAHRVSWIFTRRNTTGKRTIAFIFRSGEIKIFNQTLPGASVIKPATLIFKKVDESFNGKYEFELILVDGTFITSYVNIFIAEKPTATLNCSSTTTLSEGDDFSCLCKSENGNPPAYVSWYKDDKKISKTRKKNELLTLRDVDNTDRGIYKCLAESYPNEDYQDRKALGIVVNFPPRKINITSSQRKAKIGEAINITCESIGQPEPSFIVTHNESEIIAESTYNIPQVKWRDSGLYQCIAKNKLGSNSKCYCLTVLGEATSSKKEDRDTGDTVVVWHIVVSSISGVVIGCLLSYIVSCSRRKPRQSNPEPPKAERLTAVTGAPKLQRRRGIQNKVRSFFNCKILSVILSVTL
ncbi:limbic system-associated membrane protein-like [Dendronephthya gigantea]|uniref:limbic system-associated membrane protein-like n=1 Tax=Dendronephthya gigantea TaxID=151771 RepID=UPI00106A5599|nr:limbic system-associated membrane protein-like [Dendronephthya gigantea]